MLTRKRQ